MTNASSVALVAVSIAVSIFASFTALNLTGRIVAAEPSARRWWIMAAAVALGGGTWAMHFIGMLSVTMPATYNTSLTLLSLVLPIIASGVGLHIVSRFGVSRASLLWSGLLVGSGIVAMHYVGMAALRVPGVTIVYNGPLVGLSVAIALLAATAALWLAFRTRDTSERIGASLLMGIAISGMHYSGMAAATFEVTGLSAQPDPLIQPAILALAVVGASTFLLLLGLITAYFDRALASMTAREAAALKGSEARFRSMIETTSDIIGIIDGTGAFIYDNFSARNVLGYLPGEMAGRHPITFVQPEAEADAQRFLNTVRETPGVPVTVELPLMHRSGERREFQVMATNLLHLPAVGGTVVNLRDITERKQLIAQLETLSETDILTGALNRRGFTRIANREFERLRRRRAMATIVMFDIDHFKKVNDRYGHAAGDLVLGKVADCCRAHLRQNDLLGRIGGEEFALLLADGDTNAAPAAIARLSAAIASTSVWSIKGSVSVTASFGIATIDPATIELTDALARADEALYEAKHAGRNCIKIRA
ncbi:MAG: diguanylate cyclase [Sphingomonas sp.]